MSIGSPRWNGSVGLAMLVIAQGLAGTPVIRADDRFTSGSSCAELKTDEVRWADEIVLLPADASIALVAEAAIERWQRCEEYAIAFPRFVVGVGAGRRVRVEIEEKVPGIDSCGYF